MSKKKKTMRLRTKINLLVLLNMVLVLILAMSALGYILVDRKFKETGDRALFVARTVAGLPQVAEAFNGPDPASVLQPLAEQSAEANERGIYRDRQHRLNPLQPPESG
ncbi:hypothetical protein LJK88_01750 [Paenibacillus sp. P26]|nr:hypothetical protein LJK88_01750 [Paenibacillus sp. P26]